MIILRTSQGFAKNRRVASVSTMSGILLAATLFNVGQHKILVPVSVPPVPVGVSVTYTRMRRQIQVLAWARRAS